MKKMLALLLILTGCSMDILDPSRVMMDVHNSIRYEPDATDCWQLPSATMYRGSGDCEDFCILFMERLHLQGMESTMVITPTDTGGHAMVLFDDILYDVTGGYTLPLGELPLTASYTFDQVMGIAMHDLFIMATERK